MTFLEMTLSGAVFILAAAALRTLTLRRLPKEAFVALWWTAALRLLIPVDLPSRFSAYTLLEALEHRTSAPALSVAPALPAAPATPATAPIQTQVPAIRPTPQPAPAEPFPIWTVLWLTVAAALGLWFLVRYVRWRRRFRESFPADCPALDTCLNARRRVQLRVTDQIAAPLTYGLLRPVILLPKTLDLTDEETVTCVLAHEMVHVRRLDSLFKLVLTAVLCIHWFNPAVWFLYVLANRDMELRCDEAAVLAMGEDGRERYALALIRLAELRNECVPLCGFSHRSGMEERIRMIMSIKKKSMLACLTALAMVLGTTTAFATSAKPEEAPKAESRPAVTETAKTPGDASGGAKAPAEKLAENPPAPKADAAPEGEAAVQPEKTKLTNSVEKGTPVYAAGVGTVTETGHNAKDGYYVRIRHSQTQETFYANCQSVEVQEGDSVLGGDVVATLKPGAHLRLEFYVNGVVTDPLVYKNEDYYKCLFNPFEVSQGNGAGSNGDYSGKPVIAIMDGTVLKAGEIEIGPAYEKGPYVEIVYSDGYSMEFLACQSVLVKTGDTVKAGEVIAITGDGAHASGLLSPESRANRVALEDQERQRMEAELVNGDYPRNGRGETYGHDYYVYLGYSPDLISVWTVDGKLGYASFIEMCGCDPVTREIIRDSAAYKGGFVPVYDLEGNEIGDFFIEAGKTGSVPGDFDSLEEAQEAARNGQLDNQ